MKSNFSPQQQLNAPGRTIILQKNKTVDIWWNEREHNSVKTGGNSNHSPVLPCAQQHYRRAEDVVFSYLKTINIHDIAESLVYREMAFAGIRRPFPLHGDSFCIFPPGLCRLMTAYIYMSQTLNRAQFSPGYGNAPRIPAVSYARTLMSCPHAATSNEWEEHR